MAQPSAAGYAPFAIVAPLAAARVGLGAKAIPFPSRMAYERRVRARDFAVFVLAVACQPSNPAPSVTPEVVISGADAPEPANAARRSQPSKPGCEDLIEDGENDDNQIIVADGRNGYLYTYVDESGSVVHPESGSRGGIFEVTANGARGSTGALRIAGTIEDAPAVFAGLGLNLMEPKGPYDAGDFEGVGFWAKRGEHSAKEVRVLLPDVNTDPDGGRCSSCFNDFGKTIELSTQWQRYEFEFGELAQESGWGDPRPPLITKSALYSIQFRVTRPGPFELWFDDLHFTGCGR